MVFETTALCQVPSPNGSHIVILSCLTFASTPTARPFAWIRIPDVFPHQVVNHPRHCYLVQPQSDLQRAYSAYQHAQSVFFTFSPFSSSRSYAYDLLGKQFDPFLSRLGTTRRTRGNPRPHEVPCVPSRTPLAPHRRTTGERTRLPCHAASLTSLSRPCLALRSRPLTSPLRRPRAHTASPTLSLSRCLARSGACRMSPRLTSPLMPLSRPL